MTFEEWVQSGLASGALTRDSSNRLWSAGMGSPWSTASLQDVYNRSGGNPSALIANADQAKKNAASGQGTGVTNSPGGLGALGPQQFDPNAFTLGRQESEQDRASQLALYQQLSDQAAGKGGPSLAQMQLTEATGENQNMAAGAGMAAQSRGLGAAAALRGIGEDQAAIQQKSALQSAELKAAEQEHARQQMAALLQTMRGVDVGEAQTQLGANVQLATGQADMNAASNRDRMNLIGNAGQAFTRAAMSGGGSGAAAGSGYGGGQTPYGGPAAGFGESYNGNGDWSNQGGSSTSNWSNPYGGYSEGGAVDSPQFDTVKALLSPGEIVLPRSVAMSDDAPARAAAFVEAIKRSKRAA